MDYKREYKAPESYCNLSFDEPILNWDEGIPLGNGLTGCLIWGDGSPLNFSLDRGDLWDKRPASETLRDDFNYKKLIELVENKDQQGIRDLFDNCYNKPTPTKIPAGKLILDYGKVNNISSQLNIENAVADICIVKEEETSNIKSFIHATKKIGLMTISNYEMVKELKIIAPRFGVKSDKLEDDGYKNEDKLHKSITNLVYPKIEFHKEDNLRWFVQRTAEDLEYGIILGQKVIGDNLYIVYSIGSSIDGQDWLEDHKNNIHEALESGFDTMLVDHINWWKKFWEKSSITLYDKELEKMWYLTNYLFGACSRKNAPPMPLQGVWTADNGELPPWKGDYHNDLNTQLSYLHYLKANHIEEGESFLDFLWNLLPEGQEFAKKFFDAEGLCLPAVMTIDGKPLGGWPMYSLNLTNQIWLCQFFQRHWEYTGDDEFLENKAYPYLRETARCMLRWLKPGKDGKLYIPLSSSPEIHDDELEAWLTPNSNYDLSLLRYLFSTLCTMADVLGYEEKSIWKEKLELLPELAVNENNVLMLSPDESLKESHRHHGHAMAIYPLDLLNYNQGGRDKEIIDSTIEDLEKLGKGLWVGFSFTWMSKFYSRKGNGEGAVFQLQLFWENLCSKNGFHLNGDYKSKGLTNWHYRPFTLESNMCAADSIQEMLLQTFDRVIRVFPAIPYEWKKNGTSFNDFRGMKGILISSSIKDDGLEYIHLKAHKQGEYTVQNKFNSELIIIKRKNNIEKVNCKVGINFIVDLMANEECTITAK
ncbi:glycosyl hydrolase family 95 catalytic domain-containing protein [Vallitalea guaymasensis]|uniref:glycosyl hydrolase family 95 catalytic domain-containing protein n=1 Tax=Vallitalea guaymasensis TaxID=1185412 RepID=UPI002353425A|nr:glycoside hydrolase N-terminal domain-containing protein [Vallitalea guaymasensis]